MRDYDKISRIVNKEVISIKELHTITNSNIVKSVTPCHEDNRYPKHLKYEVCFTNDEFYWVYVKEKKFLWF